MKVQASRDISARHIGGYQRSVTELGRFIAASFSWSFDDRGVALYDAHGNYLAPCIEALAEAVERLRWVVQSGYEGISWADVPDDEKRAANEVREVLATSR
jgi:hypothetical protein